MHADWIHQEHYRLRSTYKHHVIPFYYSVNYWFREFPGGFPAINAQRPSTRADARADVTSPVAQSSCMLTIQNWQQQTAIK